MYDLTDVTFLFNNSDPKKQKLQAQTPSGPGNNYIFNFSIKLAYPALLTFNLAPCLVKTIHESFS